jgi:hypothetical protein
MANRFLNNITINDSYTFPNADGTVDQIIKTDGAGNLSFSDNIPAVAEKALSLTIKVKNSTASAMTKGQVICEAVSASPPSGNLIEVKLADNNGTDSMPAIGILNEDLDAAGGANDEGDAIMFGKVSGINTSAFSVGDEVFVSDTPGSLTITKPTGVKYIQKVGVVIRDDASNGTIEVFGAGRVNDVPTPLYIDHANQRLGIGTDNPGAKLEVNGTVDLDNLTINGAQGGDGQVLTSTGTGIAWEDASGGGSYTPSAISTNTNAVKNYLYILTASLTLTLPASPSAGDSIKIANLSGTTTCVIARNTKNIMAVGEDMTLDNQYASFELIYSDATRGWVVVGGN